MKESQTKRQGIIKKNGILRNYDFNWEDGKIIKAEFQTVRKLIQNFCQNETFVVYQDFKEFSYMEESS